MNMTTRDIVFALLAAAIAFVSNALILEIQDALTFRSLASRSAIPTLLAICPFVLGANLIENRVSVLWGALFGLGMTALLWCFAISISGAGRPEVDQDTGPFMLLLSMPFIVTSVFLVTALWRERLVSR